ncbi:alpha/beta fold hydrolase [Alteromonas gilva]|uniref:Alpha/beta hydrolase n=1 Tax=Alteromonas gilva TaxID=2987522 RepID=A0ABT5KWZ2_9ALTE|nr:alpha/beta fold hydrolase [Alteromonas gilva]MDC8829287.1 alpha/beta hydrolase [Alteromonas gilva]
MKYMLLVVISLCSISVLAAPSALQPTKSGLFDIGGFSLYLECYENDKPMLILEQGFGRAGSDGVWLDNIRRLTDTYSVCLYDRAGIGKSEQGPVPVTINDTAIRLHKLLAAAEVSPPYYFAGGSYASYVITAFNHLYEDELLGAVLIDPPPFGYFYTMGTRWPKDFTTDNTDLSRYYNFEQSVHNPMFEKAPEKIDHMQSYQQLKPAQDFGNKPLIVLRAKLTDEPYDPPFVPKDIATTMDQLFANAEQSFRALSSDTTVTYSTSEKHHLHIADRDLVVKSIKALSNKP